MPVDVTYVEPLANYRLFLKFEDGKQGIYDVSPLLESGVFKRLQDASLFNRVSIECGSVSWPGGLDIAPETLWEECCQQP